MKFIALYRVSTAKQTIEGQKLPVQQWVAAQGGTLIAEFEETESRWSTNRPIARAALQQCRLTGATLVILRFDRLTSDHGFMSDLKASGVKFVATEMPSANELTIDILISVAANEVRTIQKRTCEGLNAIRANGMFSQRKGRVVRFGRLPGSAITPPDFRLAVEARRRAADAFARRVGPMIQAQRATGCTLARIAANLEEGCIKTAAGGRWTPRSVSNVLLRCGADRSAI